MSLMCTSGCCESLATWEIEKTWWWLDPKIIPFSEKKTFTSRGILYIFGCLYQGIINHHSRNKSFPIASMYGISIFTLKINQM